MSFVHGYLAFPGYLEELKAELKFAGIKPKKMEIHGNLILVDGQKKKPVWAMNIWVSVERLEVESVSDAIRKLKSMGLRWAIAPHLHHRRAELIMKGLKMVSPKPFRYPDDRMPEKPLGSFMLIEPDVILASSQCSQTIPNGEITFQEDKAVPPTRAYLKLWEAFTRLGVRPKAGDACIDIGSCPGGWTWVIAGLGAKVVSVDRSPLDPKIAAMPEVEFVQGNAFTVDPKKYAKMDWFFSDVICEPPKLLEMVQRWLETHPTANFICSVKFKGDTDFRIMNAFQRIPGSQLMHLNHNKHEVTWVRLADQK